MKKYYKYLKMGLMMLLCCIPVICFSQLNPFVSPEAMDTMNQGSPSGGIPTGNYVDRARNAAQPPNPIFQNEFNPELGASAPVAGGVDPNGVPISSPAIPSEIPGAGPSTFPNTISNEPISFPGATSTGFTAPAFTTPKVRVLKGERVYDHWTNEILQEAIVDEVPENEIEGRYFDDGTNGDAVPNDKLFSNVSETKDYVGNFTHTVRAHYINLLTSAESLSPNDFFSIIAVSDDPVSTLNIEVCEEDAANDPAIKTNKTLNLINKELYLEKIRDDRLRSWDKRFLSFTRKNPEDQSSEFYLLFVPPPPEPPKVILPQGFDPRPKPAEAPQSGFAPYGAEGVGGGPPPGASSQYMESGGGRRGEGGI